MQATFTASLEAGGTTFVFQPTNEALASQWQKIAKFRAVHCGEPKRRQDDNEVECWNLHIRVDVLKARSLLSALIDI